MRQFMFAALALLAFPQDGVTSSLKPLEAAIRCTLADQPEASIRIQSKKDGKGYMALNFQGKDLLLVDIFALQQTICGETGGCGSVPRVVTRKGNKIGMSTASIRGLDYMVFQLSHRKSSNGKLLDLNTGEASRATLLDRDLPAPFSAHQSALSCTGYLLDRN